MSAGGRGTIRDINQCPGSAGVIGDMPERPCGHTGPHPLAGAVMSVNGWALRPFNVCGNGWYMRHPTHGNHALGATSREEAIREFERKATQWN